MSKGKEEKLTVCPLSPPFWSPDRTQEGCQTFCERRKLSSCGKCRIAKWCYIPKKVLFGQGRRSLANEVNPVFPSRKGLRFISIFTLIRNPKVWPRPLSRFRGGVILRRVKSEKELIVREGFVKLTFSTVFLTIEGENNKVGCPLNWPSLFLFRSVFRPTSSNFRSGSLRQKKILRRFISTIYHRRSSQFSAIIFHDRVSEGFRTGTAEF